MPDFVHLRTHTAYSLSEGALRVKELMKLCQQDEMPAVAMTDSQNLFGALEFSLAAADAGIQPIIGLQFNLTAPYVDLNRKTARDYPVDQLVLLAQNEEGYLNLLSLVSESYMQGDGTQAPQLPLSAFEKQTNGLIALSGGVRGSLGRLLLEKQQKKVTPLLDDFKELFPGRFYIEIQRHGLIEEDQIEDQLIDLAYAHNLPLVATNEAYYPDGKMSEAHDALLCIAEGRYVSQKDRRKLSTEHWFKSRQEMVKLFEDLPEALQNTVEIAQRCAFKVPRVNPILPAFTKAEGEVTAEEQKKLEADDLRQQAEQGLAQRFTDHEIPQDQQTAYQERLSYELDIIEQMGFPGYFLIVAEFIQWAKNHNIPVGPGRGSGAGSAVAWALTITDLDPLRFGLLFERFLNPERVSMPDFDIDFCMDRRDEVISHVQEKYGFDRVAQIITFGKLQARAVLRDVGRVLEMPYGQVDRLCKMVPNNPAKPVTLPQAIEQEPDLAKEIKREETVKKLFEVAQPLEGLYRHASTHAAGVVIGDRPLQQLVPLYRDPRSEMPVTQFNMKFVEQAGLVKFDFLGLKTLTVLADCVAFLKLRDIDLNLSQIPLDDAKTFDMLSKGDAGGVFQLESSGMRDVLRGLKPDRFEDIIAVVALYRPGPMDNIPSYIARKHGEEEPDYLHPKLEPILTETYGIMIYQEQVMQAAQILSGYSLGGADLLRRAMGKKIKEEMDKQRQTFCDGAVDQGVDRDVASRIFDQVAKFAGYGFNKSHAAAYALIAYQTAYLKANYPVEFFAALMSADLNNTDKLSGFVQELRQLKIPVLAPDINQSDVKFSVQTNDQGVLSVRYALAALKNVGEAAVASVVEERKANGPFDTLSDFANRIDSKQLNRRQLENMVRAGAFDRLEENRSALFAGIDLVLKNAQRASEERDSSQIALFAAETDKAASQIDLPETDYWTENDQLSEEFMALGFYLSAHPLDAYQKALNRLHVTQSADIAKARQETRGLLKLAGIVMAKQIRISQKGKKFAFLSLSDSSGQYEVTLFSEVLAASMDLLDAGKALYLTVDAQERDGQISLLAKSITSLDEQVSGVSAGLHVFLREIDGVEALNRILTAEGRGQGEIRLTLTLAPGWHADITLPNRYAINPKFVQSLKAVRAITHVKEL